MAVKRNLTAIAGGDFRQVDYCMPTFLPAVSGLIRTLQDFLDRDPDLAVIVFRVFSGWRIHFDVIVPCKLVILAAWQPLAPDPRADIRSDFGSAPLHGNTAYVPAGITLVTCP